MAESRVDQPLDVSWDYEYDDARRLTRAVREVDANPVTRETWTYVYDDAGNRTQKVSTDYDGSSTTTTTLNYTYNALGQLTGDGSITYEYDPYGNLEFEKQGTTVLRRYYWNDSNQLKKCVLNPNDTQTIKTIVFAYNDQGDRVRRQSGTDPAIKYLTDHNNPTCYSQVLTEINATTGEVERDFLYGAEILAQADETNGLAYLHGDNLGSTRLLTDVDGGGISNSDYNYSPYGVPLDNGADSSLTSSRFTGQSLDNDLSRQYHRARWLNPSTAGWLSMDPVFDFPNNFGNVHGYVGGNPVNNRDFNARFSAAETSVSMATISVLTNIVVPCVNGLFFGIKMGQVLYGESVIPSAIVISLSFSQVFGIAGTGTGLIGGAGSIEFLYIIEKKQLYAYKSAGVAIGTSGPSISLNLGVVWGVYEPEQYEGWYYTSSASGSFAAGMLAVSDPLRSQSGIIRWMQKHANVSVFWANQDDSDFSDVGSAGFTVGLLSYPPNTGRGTGRQASATYYAQAPMLTQAVHSIQQEISHGLSLIDQDLSTAMDMITRDLAANDTPEAWERLIMGH